MRLPYAIFLFAFHFGVIACRAQQQGAGMIGAPDALDPEFARALRTSIRGIYYRQVEGFTPVKIESEFQKAARDPAILGDDCLIANLMFLIRKKEIRSLAPDVEAVLGSTPLKPAAELSAMKTLYALGGPRERQVVDERFARRLFAEFKSGNGSLSQEWLNAAAGVGGPITLRVVEAAVDEAVQRQRNAEGAPNADHSSIARLDNLRASLQAASHAVRTKLSILASTAHQRFQELTRLYMLRRPRLSAWAFKELAGSRDPEAITSVRAFSASQLESLLPRGGLDTEQPAQLRLELQLRLLFLLQMLGGHWSPEEESLVRSNAALVERRREYFQPDYDWEDVLDRM